MPDQIYKHSIIGINSDKNTSKVLQDKAFVVHLLNFPGSSVGKESACNAGDAGSIHGSGRFPWRRKWQLTPVFLPGKSHGWRSLEGYNLQGHKELDTTKATEHTQHKFLQKETYLSPTRSI